MLYKVADFDGVRGVMAMKDLVKGQVIMELSDILWPCSMDVYAASQRRRLIYTLLKCNDSSYLKSLPSTLDLPIFNYKDRLPFHMQEVVNDQK